MQEKLSEIVTEIPTVLLRGIAEDMAGKKLVMKIQARGPDGRVIRLRVLIDTGAEVNLIKLGVLPSSYLQPSTHPLALVTANGFRMKGGKHEATLELEFKGDRKIPKMGENVDGSSQFSRRGNPSGCHLGLPLVRSKSTGYIRALAGLGH